MPVVGGGSVCASRGTAEDLEKGAIAAASSASAANKFYSLPGGNAYLPRNGRPDFRRITAAAANRSRSGLFVANGIFFRKAALSRRKCRDGNPN